MCRTVCFVATVPGVKANSRDLEVCTFETVVQSDRQPNHTYDVTVRLDEGRIISSFAFYNNQLVAVTTHFTGRKGSSKTIDKGELKELLWEIGREVSPFRTDETVYNQISTYAKALPDLILKCRERASTEPVQLEATKALDRVLSPSQAVSA
jgi:hypothetical protein